MDTLPLGDVLFFDDLYRQIINVQGALIGLGGNSPNNMLNLWHGLQGVYEYTGNRIIDWVDGSDELVSYLEDNCPILALVYFSTESYEETKQWLELIQPHLTTGSIVVFSTLNRPDCPGPTMALKETWGLNTFAVQRSFYSPNYSYIVIA